MRFGQTTTPYQRQTISKWSKKYLTTYFCKSYFPCQYHFWDALNSVVAPVSKRELEFLLTHDQCEWFLNKNNTLYQAEDNDDTTILIWQKKGQWCLNTEYCASDLEDEVNSMINDLKKPKPFKSNTMFDDV